MNWLVLPAPPLHSSNPKADGTTSAVISLVLRARVHTRGILLFFTNHIYRFIVGETTKKPTPVKNTNTNLHRIYLIEI